MSGLYVCVRDPRYQVHRLSEVTTVPTPSLRLTRRRSPRGKYRYTHIRRRVGWRGTPVCGTCAGSVYGTRPSTLLVRLLPSPLRLVMPVNPPKSGPHVHRRGWSGRADRSKVPWSESDFTCVPRVQPSMQVGQRFRIRKIIDGKDKGGSVPEEDGAEPRSRIEGPTDIFGNDTRPSPEIGTGTLNLQGWFLEMTDVGGVLTLPPFSPSTRVGLVRWKGRSGVCFVFVVLP